MRYELGRVSKGTVDTANRQLRMNTPFPESLSMGDIGSLRGFKLQRLKFGGRDQSDKPQY